MYVKKEIDFEDLKNICWSDAIDTLEEIENAEKEEELMELLESNFGGRIPTETEINDFLWFEDDFIFEQLNMDTLIIDLE